MRVEYLDSMGSCLSIVNAARCSFDREHTEFDEETDSRLLRYLAREKHWCYDDQTEILSDRGWIKFSDLRNGDNVAQVFGWETGEFSMEFVHPLEIHNDPFYGNMILSEGSTSNYCVTPQHRMLYQKSISHGYNDWAIGSSNELFGMVKRMRTTAVLKQQGDGNFFQGAYIGFLLGDGSRGSKNRAVVRLKVGRKIAFFRNLLEELGKTYTLTVTTNNVHVFSINDSTTELAKCHEKSIPDIRGMSSAFIQGLFYGLMESDGSVKHGGWSYTTSSRKLMDDLVWLAALCGYSVSENAPRHIDHQNHHVNYRCAVLSRNHCVINRCQGKESLRPYHGMVYCVTVPSGMVMTRRNGKQLVCGNTPFAAVTLSLRITAPIFVSRQLEKHYAGLVMGTAVPTRSEVSRRYVDAAPEFYFPAEWRSRPEKSIKQGSGEALSAYPHSRAAAIYDDAMSRAERAYYDLLAVGVAPEMARMVLPQSLLTTWIWTGSLAAFHRVYALRIDRHAQQESQFIAERIGEICAEHYPRAWDALNHVG